MRLPKQGATCKHECTGKGSWALVRQGIPVHCVKGCASCDSFYIGLIFQVLKFAARRGDA